MIGRIAMLWWIWIPITVGLVIMDYQDWDANTYQPLLQAVEAKKVELTQAQTALAKVEEFSKQKDVKVAKLNALLDEFEKVRKDFPTNSALPSLLKSLADISEKIGLELSNFKPTGNVNDAQLKATQVSAAQIDATIKGSYVQLMSFLDQVSSLQRIVNTESVVLKPGPMLENSQFRSVEATIKILTYYTEPGV